MTIYERKGYFYLPATPPPAEPQHAPVRLTQTTTAMSRDAVAELDAALAALIRGAPPTTAGEPSMLAETPPPGPPVPAPPTVRELILRDLCRTPYAQPIGPSLPDFGAFTNIDRLDALAESAATARDYARMVRWRSIASQVRATGQPWRPRRERDRALFCARVPLRSVSVVKTDRDVKPGDPVFIRAPEKGEP